MRTAVHKVSKFVLQSPTQIIDEATSNSASPRAWILPCWTIASHLHQRPYGKNAPEPATTQSRNMFSIPIARHVSFTDTKRCVQVHFGTEFFPLSSEDDVFNNTSRPRRGKSIHSDTDVAFLSESKIVDVITSQSSGPASRVLRKYIEV